ncbi:capsular exopolysaccharide family [Jatrophihabitans endophyticus]|uniref:non-specific protein-tyrosine kinase n=1 Tax=Jatrophihabitans endophyticus TaxID=1206085 RepID=A0A1M5IQ16_9ACTN|nr:polysaccharide biosynthesis tyrosine autokinase [Jatrophihabitans endophyticus]SHG30040.1 capsular exopolysaccharide family [Jatrophihabitans endophyticus]
MDPREFLRILRRGWPLVLVCTVLGVAAGIGLTAATSKVYEASVEVFVATSPTSDASQLAQGNAFTSDRVQSYTSVANSPDVTDAVVARTRLGLTSQQLADKITADAPQNKTLINLHVTDGSPTRAARLANAVAEEFDSVVARKVEQTDSAGKPVVKLTVIHPATVPTSPVKPNRTVNVGLGFVLGLLVGLGLVVLRDLLDNTVKGPADFENVGVPVLGMIPLDKRTARTPVAFRGDPHSTRSEAYRQLRTNLQFVKVDNAPRIIAVTSAIPGEGKSTTSMNLAAALAEAGHRVCLIEADLRRPTIGKTLGLVTDVGFTTVLIGRTSVLDALQNIGRNLAVLTSGPVPPNPSELLNSEQARNVIAEVAAHVDYTVIDTAPLLPVADGAEVAAMSQATVVVHRAGKTTREQARRSVAALEKVGEAPVGVVLNMVSRTTGRYDYENNYYYTYRPERDGHGKRGEGAAELSPDQLTPQDRDTATDETVPGR